MFTEIITKLLILGKEDYEEINTCLSETFEQVNEL